MHFVRRIPMRQLIAATALFAALAATSLIGPSLADACAGLIGSNGAVNLGRTTTLAAYNDGVEHYVTAFQFQGGGGEFGTLIPLPGVPSKVERGGGWTLQRLQLETRPVSQRASAPGVGGGALSATCLDSPHRCPDLTAVLKGGGASVAAWAQEHGFRLSPDAPEVLDFYASRSPIFMAAVFDGDAAAKRGQRIGDGTPVHLTIPTSNPWVPLRICLRQKPEDREADAPCSPTRSDVPPEGRDGLAHAHDAATDRCQRLRPIRHGWVPDSAWLTKLRSTAAQPKQRPGGR
jgi:hypothetical protein